MIQSTRDHGYKLRYTNIMSYLSRLCKGGMCRRVHLRSGSSLVLRRYHSAAGLFFGVPASVPHPFSAGGRNTGTGIMFTQRKEGNEKLTETYIIPCVDAFAHWDFFPLLHVRRNG